MKFVFCILISFSTSAWACPSLDGTWYYTSKGLSVTFNQLNCDEIVLSSSSRLPIDFYNEQDLAIKLDSNARFLHETERQVYSIRACWSNDARGTCDASNQTGSVLIIEQLYTDKKWPTHRGVVSLSIAPHEWRNNYRYLLHNEGSFSGRWTLYR